MAVTAHRGSKVAEDSEKKTEWYTFIFLVVFLAPVMAVAIVGGYGFAVWISQIILGPPGV
ncbi:MAG: periplasmic nitrate reductase, NapE protein [Gammaproteobacteria bacterium]|nr:periplasmic nitrate reductase, NapE protein [Gammaproteobacteria bacterium]